MLSQLRHFVEGGQVCPVEDWPDIPVTRVESLEFYLAVMGKTATAKECVIAGPDATDDPVMKQLVQNVLDLANEPL